MIPQRSRPARARPRARLLAVAAVALLATACLVQDNTPDGYGAQTEQNWYRGCLAAFGVDTSSLEGAADTTEATDGDGSADADSDEVGPDGDGEFEVAIPEGATDAQVSYCGCVYDGMVENVSFDTFKDVNGSLGDLPSAGDEGDEDEADGGDDTTTTTLIPQNVRDIVEGCPAPS